MIRYSYSRLAKVRPPYILILFSYFTSPFQAFFKKFSPLIISHGLFDEVVPIDASRIIYEKVKSKSSKFCELLEFEGFHQIDSNLIKFIRSNISNIF